MVLGQIQKGQAVVTSALLETSCDAADAAVLVPPDGSHGPSERPREESTHRPGQMAAAILTVAAWTGLVTGTLEGVYWLFRQQVLGDMVFMHPHFLWMSPTAQLVAFLVLGGMLAVLPWITRSADVVPFAATLLFFVAWLNTLLLLVGGLHFWAWVLLAAGLAAATGKVLRKHADRFLRFARRTTGWLLLLLAIVAVVQEVRPRLREASAIAALPASPADAPNVLLVVLDTVRADALGTYGASPDLTPNLDRLARRGVVFDNAWSTAPWTLPSMAGMFTGRLPHELSTDWLAKLDGDPPTIAGALAAGGWLTGGFVGNTRYCSAETGLDRGFSHYAGYRLSSADFLLCTSLGRKIACSSLPTYVGWFDTPGRKDAAEVNDSFLSWLDERDGRPYFAFLNYWDVHDPYFPPPEFGTAASYTSEQKSLLRHWWWMHKEDLTPEQAEFLRGAYDDCLRGLDRELGRLFDELEKRGELDNTLIILTADHGEHFGEHDLYLHGNSLYEPLLHVPLVLICPERIPGGRRVDVPVSLQDLPATILALTGEEPSLPGQSFAEYWESGQASSHRPNRIAAELPSQAVFPPCHGHSPVAAGPMQCVRIGPFKYVLNGDGREELYDLDADPTENHNLAVSAEQKARLLQLFDHQPGSPATRRPAQPDARAAP